MRALAVVSISLLALLAGCGNAVEDVEPAGVLALTADADGHVVVVARVCRSTIDEVVITRDREGLSDDEENAEVATYSSSSPLDGEVRLDLDAPSTPWSPTRPVTLEKDRGYLVTAQGSADGGHETSTVWATGRLLDQLEPGRFYVSDPSQDRPNLESRSETQLAAAAQKACGTD